jgi:hypothetical protein
MSVLTDPLNWRAQEWFGRRNHKGGDLGAHGHIVDRIHERKAEKRHGSAASSIAGVVGVGKKNPCSASVDSIRYTLTSVCDAWTPTNQTLARNGRSAWLRQLFDSACI